MTYLAVFDGERAGWHVDRRALLTSLGQDWPDVVPRVGESELRDVSWILTGAGAVFEGYSHSDGTCLYLDGDLATTAKFAVWYRALVPDRIEVMFCDDEYTFAVPVNADTTSDDLVAAADYRPAGG